METIILAAGSSKRMGQTKLLLPYKGEPLVIHALRAALEASTAVIVVTGSHAMEIEKTIASLRLAAGDHLRLIHNPHYHDGQFSSTLSGVQAVSRESDFAISMADLPLVTAGHYRRLEKLLDGYDAVRPFCEGIPGHPVVCAAALRNVILALPASATMRELLTGKNVLLHEDGDVAWTADIDTPEAYQRLINQC